MNTKNVLVSIMSICMCWLWPYTAMAQSTNHKKLSYDVERPRPIEWEGLKPGMAFIDRFLPLHEGKISSAVWGANGVIPRYVDNGIEDDIRSYWGGNILQDKQGVYHMFISGWPEDHPKGHHAWPKSVTYNAISKNLSGPYQIVDTICQGFNPEAYRTKDGKVVLYSVDMRFKPQIHVSNDCHGPWVKQAFPLDAQDRAVIDGTSNCTFARRPDGSVLMVNRGGGVWVSETGLTPFRLLTDKRVYPDRVGCFEDPVVWRDSVQYHMIVNDWAGRIAYYLRSPNGVDWKECIGEAYAPGIAKHADGHVEDWYKFERIKIFQDVHGRAIQANFAVPDVLKNVDKGNDNHSAKNICIPLKKDLLLKWGDAPKGYTVVEIAMESHFLPERDLDLASIKMGDEEETARGGGVLVERTETLHNGDLRVYFKKVFPQSVFAPRLVAKDKKGHICTGYVKRKDVVYERAILSACRPNFLPVEKNGSEVRATVKVSNMGVLPSHTSKLKIYTLHGKSYVEVGNTIISGMEPYEEVMVPITLKMIPVLARCEHFLITIEEGDYKHPNFAFHHVVYPCTKVATENPIPLVNHLLIPEEGIPSAGKWVSEAIPEYRDTKVHHMIYLPIDYDKNKQYPVIVELTGNQYKGGFTGRPEEAHLGYAATLGKGAIVVAAPYVSELHQENQLKWWGDADATADYLKKLVPYLVKNYNADAKRFLLCGFSRGAIGASFIGLHDDEVAKLWCAFLSHDHFDGQRHWKGTSWGTPMGIYQSQARVRLERVAGRPWYVSFNDNIEEYDVALKEMGVSDCGAFTFAPVPIKKRFSEIPNRYFQVDHNDCFPLFDFPEANNLRAWVKKQLKL